METNINKHFNSDWVCPIQAHKSRIKFLQSVGIKNVLGFVQKTDQDKFKEAKIGSFKYILKCTILFTNKYQLLIVLYWQQCQP